jgi:NhaP-type Na+/H+ or K+/H+ antiporter
LIFDERDLPWTIRLGLGWTIILALTSVGLLFMPLGIYLGYWVRTRRGHSAALWCYLIFTVICILSLLVPNELPRNIPPLATAILTVVATVIGVGGLALLVAAPLVLRGEIRSIYRRSWGMELPINRLLTVLFSSLYLNYSLPDLPVPPFASIASQEAQSASGPANSGEA